MTAAQVKAIFASMKTTFPNSLKTMAYKGKSAIGIVTKAEFPASLSTGGNEDGVESERITVDCADMTRPENGDEIMIDGRASISDGSNPDPTGALFIVDYHFQKPVVIDPTQV